MEENNKPLQPKLELNEDMTLKKPASILVVDDNSAADAVILRTLREKQFNADIVHIVDDRQIIYVNGIKFREKPSSNKLSKAYMNVISPLLALGIGLPSFGRNIDLPKDFDLIKEYEQILKFKENPSKANKSRLTSRQRYYVEDKFESTYERVVDQEPTTRMIDEFEVDPRS